MAIKLPVGYDENFVIALGLEEIRSEGGWQWMEVPLRRSAAITPLWWWLMAVPTLVAGELSLAAIRTVPVLLGLATPIVAWWMARRRFGSDTALIFAALVSTSDLLSYANCRGEYFETLVTIFALGAACLVGKLGASWSRGLLWLGILAAFFGKGIVIVGLAGLAELAVAALDGSNRKQRLRELGLALGVAILPMVAWFVVADGYLSSIGGLKHASLDSPSVWGMAYDITLGYSTTRSHMVSSPLDALQVYLDAYVWPITTLTAVPLLAGLILALRTSRMSYMPGDAGLEQSVILGLAIWTFLGAGVVISRGMVGSRFHLLYLPALWLLVAIVASRYSRPTPPIAIANVGALWAAHLGLAWSWTSWTLRSIAWPRAAIVAIAIAGVLTILGVLKRSRTFYVQNVMGIAALVLICTVSLTAGPWKWALTSFFEPMQGSTDMISLDHMRSGVGSGRPEISANERGTLYVYLTNYYTTQNDFVRAERFGKLAVEETPDNVLAWTYLGLAYDAKDAPRLKRLEIWEHALQLKPESAMLRERRDAAHQEHE